MAKGDHIKYSTGYKYQLVAGYVETNGHPLQTPITGYDIDLDFIRLSKDGSLEIKRGYAWDGASGLTIDTKSAMRGPLGHDALYQLLRMDLIGQRHRKAADLLMYNMLLEDGMWKWRADYWYWAVRKLAMSSANAENDKKIITAP